MTDLLLSVLVLGVAAIAVTVDLVALVAWLSASALAIARARREDASRLFLREGKALQSAMGTRADSVRSTMEHALPPKSSHRFKNAKTSTLVTSRPR